MQPDRKTLEVRLDDFDPEIRRAALEELAKIHPPPVPAGRVNLHLHSFFSYNARGWSPSRIAFEAYRRGWFGVGLCDFDVLEGRGEFIDACTLLGVRCLVNVETRTYFDAFSEVDIDSPGEPGVSYVAGSGFARPLPEGSVEHRFIQRLRNTAAARNRALVARVNAALPGIAIDYEQDVCPRSPSRTPTERHIVAAYIDRAAASYKGSQLTAFWAIVLELGVEECAALIQDETRLQDAVRARLAKRGGLGYQQPDEDTFPPLETFFAWVRSCGAVPMESWLDGSSEGERDGAKLLDASRERGAAALNLIPDRNWNVKSPELRAEKLSRLRAIISAAKERGMPLHIGTEMNRAGQPLEDDLDNESLRPFKEDFLHGAKVLLGHALLMRFADYGYAGPEAETEFEEVAERNAFFASVGALPAVTPPLADTLLAMGDARALDFIRDCAHRGAWPEN